MRKPSAYKSFLNASRGILLMIKTERNFRIELLAFLINLFLIFYLKLSSIDSVLILIISMGVLSAEAFNTAIEKICDFIRPEFDKNIGFIKDVSAGAVILMIFASVIVGTVIYWKYIFV